MDNNNQYLVTFITWIIENSNDFMLLLKLKNSTTGENKRRIVNKLRELNPYFYLEDTRH